jgi:hypothetical protein
MVAAYMSEDAFRVFKLRSQVTHLSATEQQLAKFADFQQAALLETLDNVAALEKMNRQLRQSLLMSLRKVMAKVDGGLAQEATCAHVARQLALLTSLQKTSNSQELLKDHPLGLESEQGSDQNAEIETVESNLNGSSDSSEWPENATTVLIRNMPPRSTIDELLKAFPPDGSYDLVNLPFNVKARRTSSFATIDFVSVDLAKAFCERFNGQFLPHSTRSCKSPLLMGPAKIQGLEANLAFLSGESAVSETRNPALLPRLYLCGAAAERLSAAAPQCIQQPDKPGQPRRLDFRAVLLVMNTAEA